MDFLKDYSNYLEIVVIENPSANSSKIGSLVKKYGKAGHISRYYLFDENITGNAYDTVINKEIGQIAKSPFVLITDGDLTSDNASWLKEETGVLKKNKEVFAIGASLDMSNLPLKAFPDARGWIPADIAEHKNYVEAHTGGHLLMFRGKEFADFLQWKKRKKYNFVDGIMHDYCYNVLGKRWARTKSAKVYHLTWDLYQDKKHPYTRLKTKKSFQDTWYHKNNSDYKLVEF